MDTDHIDPTPPSHPDVADQVDRMTNEGGPDTSQDTRSRFDRFMQYSRAHPRTMVIGAAALGLFGGIEIAAAMLLGAGVAALVKLPDRAPPMAGVRGRARSFVERVRNTVTKVGNEH